MSQYYLCENEGVFDSLNGGDQPPWPSLTLAKNLTKARNTKCTTTLDHAARAAVGCSRLLARNVSLSKVLRFVGVMDSRSCFVLHGKP